MKRKKLMAAKTIRQAWADRNTTTVVASTFPQWVPYPSLVSEEIITVVEVVHESILCSDPFGDEFFTATKVVQR